MLIYDFSSGFRGQYRAVDERSDSKTSLTSTEWTRVTFVRKDNGDPHLLLNNDVVSQGTHTGDSFTLNTAIVINLASTLSSHSSWSAENIQLSDLSLWTDIPNDLDGWAKGSLPGVLGTYFGTCACNFSKVSWYMQSNAVV